MARSTQGEVLRVPDEKGQVPASIDLSMEVVGDARQMQWLCGDTSKSATDYEHIHKLAKTAQAVSLPDSQEQFQLLELGGSGRRAHVYRVANAQGEQFALKIARNGAAEEITSLELEYYQYKLLTERGIEYPEVVQTGDGYILRQWAEGDTGDDWLADESWQQNDVNALATFIRGCIEQDVIIGDFKPGNLVLREDGTWQCIDAGRLTIGLGARAVYQQYRRCLIRKWLKRTYFSWPVVVAQLNIFTKRARS